MQSTSDLPARMIRLKEEVVLPQSTDRVGFFLFCAIVAYLATVVFEGPLRYGLSALGFGTLIYLRDAVMVLAVILGMFKAVVQDKNVTAPIVVVSYFLGLYFCLGLLLGEVTLFASLFGLKIFGTFIFGMAASSAAAERIEAFLRIVRFFLAFSVFGVTLNSLVGKYPWEGMNFETSFGVTSTTKEWWVDGERRLPGFARASFDAAMIVGICFAFLLPSLGRARAIVVGLVCLVAVYMTTSKGMTMAIGVVIFWWCLVPESGRKQVGALIAGGFLALMLLFPMASCLFELDSHLVGEVPKALSSFVDRVTDMWPRSCAILQSPHSWFLGAGIGSIGVPQQYSWLSNGYSAADNLFVYLFVNGGLLWGFGLVATVGVGLRRERSDSFFDDNRVRSLLIVMTGYGITTNMQEQAFYSGIAGMLAAQIWCRTSIMKQV